MFDGQFALHNRKQTSGNIDDVRERVAEISWLTLKSLVLQIKFHKKYSITIPSSKFNYDH